MEKFRENVLIVYSPQNGMPSGVQLPLSQTLRAGPSSSKPRSHEYEATAWLLSVSSENVTVLWAGEPGKLHFFWAEKRDVKKKEIN